MNAESSEVSSKIDRENQVLGYGGWLRFFRIINLLYAVVAVAAVGALFTSVVFLGSEDKNDLIDSLLIALELTPGTIFSIIVWKAILNINDKTPGRIVGYLKMELAIHFILYVFLYFLYSKGLLFEKPTAMIGSLIYYGIWSSYLRKSKRVLSTYGANAI